PEGKVIRILERAQKQVVGTFEDNRSFGFVIPDDTKIANDVFIPKNKTKGAMTGHKVVVDITKYPERRKSAEGVVTQILGHKNDPENRKSEKGFVHQFLVIKIDQGSDILLVI